MRVQMFLRVFKEKCALATLECSFYPLDVDAIVNTKKSVMGPIWLHQGESPVFPGAEEPLWG